MSGGILVSTGGGAAWAWCGVEITASLNLRETAVYRELTAGDRYQKAMQGDGDYLRRLAGMGSNVVVELRWIRNPADTFLRLVVLGRVQAPDAASAVEWATQLRRHLAAVPPHVFAEPIVDDEQIQAVISPFVPNEQGMVGLTKRCVTATPTRPAGWNRYFAVHPLNETAQSWHSVLSTLYQQEHPTVIGVALQPHVLDPGRLRVLGEIAARYSTLAMPAQTQTGLLAVGMVEYAPDPFAEAFAPVFADAVRRYQNETFLLRVAIASHGPIDSALGNALAGAISPPVTAGDAAGQGHARTRIAVTPYVERPLDGDQQVFRSNFQSLSTTPWGGDRAIWHTADAPPPWMRDEFMRTVDVEEATAAFRFPAAADGPIFGFRVVTRSGQAHKTEQQFDLGERVEDGAMGERITLNRDDLTRHALVVGQAGTGKTTTVLGLCRQIWIDHQVPFLVIDPIKDNTDYRMFVLDPQMEDVVVLTLGSDGVAPLRINPFQVSLGVKPSDHALSVLTSFKAACGLWPPLPEIYSEALIELYRNTGLVLDEPFDGVVPESGWPKLDQFADELDKAVKRRYPTPASQKGEVYNNVLNGAVGRARSLLVGSVGRVLDCDTSYPVEQLLGRPTVIEAASLAADPEAQSLVISLLLSSMTSHFKRNWRSTSGLRHVTVIEEAHRLLTRADPGGDPTQPNAKAQAAEMFANSLAENRGYGEGIVIVEQVPTKLIQDAVKNSNLKILHLVPGPDDQLEMTGAMGLTDDQPGFIMRLRRGEAFVKHDGLDSAVVVRMPPVPKPPEQPDDAVVHRRFVSIGGPDHELVTAIRPFADCAACSSPCSFRSRATSVAGPNQVEAVRANLRMVPHSGNKAYAGRKITTSMKTAWWTERVVEVHALQPLRAGTTPLEQVDELTCRFIHLLRRANKARRLSYVNRFRDAATIWVEGRGQNDG